jgi:hypothetical protein
MSRVIFSEDRPKAIRLRRASSIFSRSTSRVRSFNPAFAAANSAA